MELKHSIMTGMLGRQADRFHEYQPHRDFEERLAIACRIDGAEGVEVVYPGEFPEPDKTIAAIRKAGAAVSAVNLNVKSQAKWRRGSFTNPDKKLRRQAVSDLKTAMELAAELGTSMVSCCPLIDGHNYAFQVDYTKQWGWLEECIAEGAASRPDIRLSLEYKANESSNYCLLRDMGRTLFLCERLGMENVGVTMDVGHALIAGETPAEMLCLAAQAGRLFYVHFNDNARDWDWDMLPGSVNLWDLLEMLFYLDRMNWQGWLAYDVLTRHGDVEEQMNATIAIMKTAQSLLDKIGRETIQGFIEEGIPARTFEQLVKSLL